ncbi:Coiled-coil domain-containing protein, putative [Perkinsus marinus ATCC 50983]|uniref:Coiled-coil domain-containing protein, putative n=1 Tax=Perkinsus marinus (strain ATCC 50983 / TXsc) TaxID=423536 RepID=C5KLB9_PERM5|nr:Coiled-coil domain-containing protein, putative [Perkinsus marinus ATCC 50983]EER14792.1 Coiled-coil domain-containing protein, putative [Perkinsus marinus ATCC 50983]|eukprot:XP_002782996.1 Coiled-coil domain-containing protein, putative [Perkinsus marinus ATCC 50983]
MVFFYDCCDPRYKVYMGRDKYENEELLKYGWPEDVWFHVDDHSSAHVYLRRPVELPKIDDIPEEVLEEMCQLTKNNSIEGSKASKVDIVYTGFKNLRKGADMVTGQVGFHDTKKCKFVRNLHRDREIVKRIEKTKREAEVDLYAEREERDRKERLARKKAVKERAIREKAEKEAAIKEKELRSYKAFDVIESIRSECDELKTSNVELGGDGTIESCREIEDDFM